MCRVGRYLKEKHGSEKFQEIMKGKKGKEEGRKVISYYSPSVAYLTVLHRSVAQSSCLFSFFNLMLKMQLVFFILQALPLHSS